MKPITADQALPESHLSGLAAAGDFRVVEGHQHATIEESCPWTLVLEEVATGVRVNVSLLPVYGVWEELVEAAAAQARKVLSA